MVHELMKAYGLLGAVREVPSYDATEQEICHFHSSDYVTYLKTAAPADEQDLQQHELEDLYGLGKI